MISRTSRSRAAAPAALLLLQSLVLAQGSATLQPRPADGPLTFNTATSQRIKVTQVAGGLVHPYSLAFPDAHTMQIQKCQRKIWRAQQHSRARR